MESVFSFIAIAIIAVLLCVLLRKENAAYGLFVSIAAGLILLLAVLEPMRTLLTQITQLADRIPLHSSWIAAMIKIVGVCFLGEWAIQLCKDAQENAIAVKLEICIRILVLFLCIPILSQLIELIFSLLGGSKSNVKYKRIMMFFISVAMLLCIPLCCCAEESVESIIQEKMDGIDFAPLDEMFREINDAAISELGGNLSFSGMVEKILNGSLEINFDTMFSLLFSLFFSGIKDLLPLILELFVLSILSAVILNLKGNFQEQIGEAIRFVTYLIASALLFQSFIAIVLSVKDIIGGLIRMLSLLCRSC